MESENQNPVSVPYNPERPEGVEGQPPTPGPVPEILSTGIRTEQVPVTPTSSTPPPIMDEIPKPKNNSIIFLAVSLVVVSLGSLGYWAYKNYITSSSTASPQPSIVAGTPSPTPIDTPDPTTGKFCGGITGKVCPEGYACKLDGNYPDAGGVCIKSNEEIPAITKEDLSLGWYWAIKNQKKPNTPANWIYTDAGRSSCWHKPNVQCTFLPDQ